MATPAHAEYLRTLAQFLEKDLKSKDPKRRDGALTRVRRAKPVLRTKPDAELIQNFRFGDAQDTIAFEQGFASWQAMVMGETEGAGYEDSGVEDLIRAVNRKMADGERGALLLLSEGGGLVFRTQVKPGLYLGFDFIPENYPRISGGFLEVSKDEMKEGIQRHYAGWEVVKNNFDVPVDDDGTVAEAEDEREVQQILSDGMKLTRKTVRGVPLVDVTYWENWGFETIERYYGTEAEGPGGILDAPGGQWYFQDGTQVTDPDLMKDLEEYWEGDKRP